MQPFNSDDDNNIEFIEQLLDKIKSGQTPYIDSCDITDYCDTLLAEQRHDDAMTIVDYGLSLQPESTELLLTKSSILIDINKLKEAHSLLEYLEYSESENADFHVTYGWYHLRQDNIHTAIQHFDMAIQLDVDNIGIAYEIGLNLNQFGHHKHAIKYLQAFVDKNPNDPEGLFELAFALDKEEQTDLSMHYYEELVDKFPFYETAWFNLGIIYNNKELFDKAIMAYETAVSINPEYPDPYFNMGNTYLNTCQYEKALDCYTEFASFRDEECWSRTLLYIGECWFELGDKTMASRFYNYIYQHDPKDTFAMYALALCFIDLKQYDEAKTLLHNAMHIENDKAELHFALAQAAYESNDYIQAYQSLADGIKIEPNEAFAWLELAILHFEVFKSDKKSFYSFASCFIDNSAFKIIDAFINYKYYNKIDTAIDFITQIASDDPEMIMAAAQEEKLLQMFEDKQIYPIIKKFDITL